MAMNSSVRFGLTTPARTTSNTEIVDSIKSILIPNGDLSTESGNSGLSTSSSGGSSPRPTCFPGSTGLLGVCVGTPSYSDLDGVARSTNGVISETEAAACLPSEIAAALFQPNGVWSLLSPETAAGSMSPDSATGSGSVAGISTSSFDSALIAPMEELNLSDSAIGSDHSSPYFLEKKCPRHVNEPVNVYCASHECDFCHLCQIQRHSKCEIRPLVNVLRELADDLKKKFYNTVKSKFDELIDQCDLLEAQAEVVVKELYECGIVQQRREALLKRVFILRDIYRKQLSNQANICQRFLYIFQAIENGFPDLSNVEPVLNDFKLNMPLLEHKIDVNLSLCVEEEPFSWISINIRRIATNVDAQNSYIEHLSAGLVHQPGKIIVHLMDRTNKEVFSTAKIISYMENSWRERLRCQVDPKSTTAPYVITYDPPKSAGRYFLSVFVNGQLLQDRVYEIEILHNLGVRNVFGPSMIFGNCDGTLQKPYGVTCNGRQILITDRIKHEILVYDPPGRLVGRIGRQGTGPGEFSNPCGIKIDKLGRIIVADKDNHRVQVFSSEGQYLFSFGKHGNLEELRRKALEERLVDENMNEVSGRGRGAYMRKTVKESGCRYPGDAYYKRSFSPATSTSSKSSCKNSKSYGPEFDYGGFFNYPWGIAINSKNEIAVADSQNKRVQLFTANGVYICQTRDSLQSPRDLAFLKDDSLVVSDFNAHRLVIFGPKLTFKETIGGPSTPGIQFNRPNGLAVDIDKRVIAVADSRNFQVSILRSTPQGQFRLEYAFGSHGTQGGEFGVLQGLEFLSNGSLVTVEMETLRAQVFHKIHRTEDQP